MVLSCFRCESNEGPGARYQNEKYGHGMRVHNQTQSRQSTKLLHRCTVCGHERTRGNEQMHMPVKFLKPARPL